MGRPRLLGLRPETVNLGSVLTLAGAVSPGDVVAMHWDWVCDRLDPAGLRHLRNYTMRHLDMVNSRLAHPGPAAMLE
jgi:hypothetical protein